MAIYKRERSFNNILKEISVLKVPLQFVSMIKCQLRCGDLVEFNKQDFEESEATDVECMIRNWEFYDQIEDFQIRIDFSKVEKDVDVEVSKLLDKINNDQGNISN
jgi:hypothetical protein